MTSPATVPLALPTSLPLLAGPQLLGVFFNWGLLGVLTLQCYSYYDNFNRTDRLSLKFLVLSVFIYEWVQTGLITAAAMQIYVYDYGNVISVLAFHNTWFSATIMCGLISAVVQIFFAWRIFKLSRSPVLGGSMAAFIVALAVVQTIACIITGVKEKAEGIASALHGQLLTVAILWLGGTVVVDVLIAVCMTYLLLRRKTGISSTDALINRMVRLVVETGTLTASLSILVLITANIRPLHETLVYQAPALILTKMYSNTFLTNLNSRVYLRKYTQSTCELPPASGVRFANSGTSAFESSRDQTSTEEMAQKSFALAGALESSRSAGSAMLRRDAGTESDDAVSEKSEKRRQRRNSIV
ncbi:uncharacterized protein B0H18DRAFT_1214951 [Fomitopsis serialis]|uniref:uncharacterized protein n=1 Tax=Fomitopsis serialis TaxID=139415 RepID=UPI002008A4EC|nr:uncharacterized protein B0H18DRAFT_1214951 [Neoantrodia serialis]KAH9916815.1 hypothetical protein B0H18DRAFT_1214951 [Neoantrodia serialis]